MRKYILFILSFLFLNSCLKKEFPIPKKEHNTGNEVAITLGNNYKKQVFFNLVENKIIASNNKEIWDIGFETGNTGWHVISNVAKNMFVYYTDKTNLSDLTSKYGYTSNPQYDKPSGDMDSTGIGDWTDGFVRLIDMGYTAEGQALGWYKLKIISVTPTAYYFEYAKLQETNVTQDSILKDDAYNFMFYSMIDKGKVDVEPKKATWDLVFTQYIQHLTEPAIMDYLLTGCLLNRYQTKAILVTNIKYEDIDLMYAQTLSLANDMNAIGYDWKDVGLTQVMEGGTANYTVFPNKAYVIQDQHGNYFKLKFLDFYSKTGEKGTPTFTFEELN
ncbi:MAG: HmuY family protein [Brumimicrobium sp.]|nr:HmuY family protein [Brumimicrobium sp.]MCO5268446.1 HmuY family protein [Brumimicrobium sp.]